jgi:2-polyprenyl-3-methyl-5-hydroxy-6-metoxy-1,4-benzoquinol methylase
MAKGSIDKEAESFDKQVDERIAHGFVPDLQNLKNVSWFYNNVWRDPKFVRIHLMQQVNFILDITKQRKGKVMEIGCGYGYLTLEMARNGMDVTGIDLSPRSIEIAKAFAKKAKKGKNFGSLRYECGDIFAMDLGKNEYDSIVFFGALHHMPNMDIVLKKVKSALKDGGNLVFCEPMRGNFTRQSAEFAAILRVVLPTWVSYDKKLKDLDNPKAWEKYVDQIYDEYTCKGEHEQSPCDNSVSSEKVLLDSVKKHFSIKTVMHSDAFIERLIGGLRGKDSHKLAKFLKFLDNDMIRRNVLPAVAVNVHAVKKSGLF